MYVVFESDEGWSLMTLVTAAILDNVDLSEEGKNTIRRWRSDHADGTVEMDDLTEELNEALNGLLDEKFTRKVKRKGRYVTSRER
jgi:hypothetical protein